MIDRSIDWLIDWLIDTNTSLTHTPQRFIIIIIIIIIMFYYVCVDDEHFDALSERRGHVRVVLHSVDRRCRGGRHQHVAQKQPWSVRLSLLAGKASTLLFCHHVYLRHSGHGSGSLHGRHLSTLVQQQCNNNNIAVTRTQSATLFAGNFIYQQVCLTYECRTLLGYTVQQQCKNGYVTLIYR